MNFTVELSPPGLQYTAGAVAEGVPARTFTLKHGFAALNILDSGIVVDGLNDAGLSAAYLWQESAMLSGNYHRRPRAGAGSRRPAVLHPWHLQ